MTCFISFLVIFSLNFLISASISHNPILPKSAIIAVIKDLSTHQYVAKLFMGDNLAPVNLVVDLNSPFVWVDCKVNSPFSSYQPIKSCSLACSMAKSSSCGSGYNSRKTCTLQTENTITRMSTSGELNEDRIGLEMWDGISSGSIAKSGEFIFSCAPNLLLKGLANGAKGMLGLGNSRIALPSQVSTDFGFFQRKFSICLSKSKGGIFLGGNPHESEISRSMIFTPLISNKNGYYMNVNSIKISGVKLSFTKKLAKISTILPYTTLESEIFRPFVEAYVSAASSMNLTLVPPVIPFEVCFSSKEVERTPIVDFYLQSEMVKWRIHEKNLMVTVGDDVTCLGMLDGGLGHKDSIVIGGYQLEDYFVEFNLGNSMIGFSSSLLLEERECSDFQESALF